MAGITRGTEMATSFDGERKDLSRLANAACVPLFIGDYFGIQGRGPAMLSASGTLVQFHGRLFVITCEHVRKEAYARKGWTPSIAVGRAIINLSSWAEEGLIPALREVRIPAGPRDVSIAELPMHYLGILGRDKPKAPIDLDKFRATPWDQVKYCLAVGFPMKLKQGKEDLLLSPMLEVCAELDSKPKPDEEFITLHSALESPVPKGFSGVSGGPIFALTSELPPYPVGMIFEGHPSGEDGDRDRSQAFFTDNDVFIRGLVLTPQTFETWLANAV